MNDSEVNEVPGAKPTPNVTESKIETTKGLKTLSEWAEFSFLIQKLDGDYAENMDVPLELWPEEPKSTDT